MNQLTDQDLQLINSICQRYSLTLDQKDKLIFLIKSNYHCFPGIYLSVYRHLKRLEDAGKSIIVEAFYAFKTTRIGQVPWRSPKQSF